MADVVSWVSKPGRYLFHNTPVIPDNHFTSFLFSILKPQRTIRTFLRLFFNYQYCPASLGWL